MRIPLLTMDSDLDESIVVEADSQEDSSPDHSVVSHVSDKKRRRSKSGEDSSDEEDDRLEDDDYQLLEENLGIRFKKKFRRLRVLDDDSNDEDGEEDARDKDKIAEELFDLDDEPPKSTTKFREQREIAKIYSSEESSDDEIGDFIVDESDIPIRHGRQGTVRNTDKRLQDAQDIFGVDFNPGEFEQHHEDSDDDDIHSTINNKKSLKLQELYEPSILERLHLSAVDFEICKTDIPERFQRCKVPELNSSELSIKDEATWIYEKLQTIRKEVGEAYDNWELLEDDSYNFDKPGEPTTLGRRLQTDSNGNFMSSFIDGNTNGQMLPPAANIASATDDDWGTSSTVASHKIITQEGTTASSIVNGLVKKQPPVDDDDDDWEKTSNVPASITGLITKATPKVDDDDDDWGESSTVVSSHIPQIPASLAGTKVTIKQQQAKDDDDDDWGNSSTVVSQQFSKSLTGTASIVPPTLTTPAKVLAANAIDDEDDEWGNSSSVVSKQFSKCFTDTTINTNVPATENKPVVAVQQTTDNTDDWDTSSTTLSQLATQSHVTDASLKKMFAEEEAKKSEKVIEKIELILKDIKEEKLDVPYIAYYLKSKYMPELTVADLWNIQRLDVIYCKMHKSKCSLLLLVHNTMLFMDNEANKEVIESFLGRFYRAITPEDFDYISSIRSPEEIDDFRSFYNFQYGRLSPLIKLYLQKNKQAEEKEKKTWDNGENDLMMDITTSENQTEDEPDFSKMDSSFSLWRPIRSKCDTAKSRLADFLPHYGMTSADLAQNIVEEYSKIKPNPASEAPLQIAENFTSSGYILAEHVLNAANFVMAQDISQEPEIRRSLRNYVFEHGGLSVKPTEKGQREIDETHSLFPVKYLRNKLISKFKRDIFLALLSGEQDDLIQISISEEFKEKLKKDLIGEVWVKLFTEDGFSTAVQSWNNAKKLCLEKAVLELMLPKIFKDVKFKLESDAKKYITRFCTGRIEKLIRVGEYKFIFRTETNAEVKEIPPEWSTKDGIRVMGIAFCDASIMPFACVIDSNGQVIDHTPLKDFVIYWTDNKEQLALQTKCLKIMAEFIKRNKPHVIVLSGETTKAATLQFLVKGIATEMSMNNEDDDEFPVIDVQLMNNEYAKVYANSNRGKSEFKEFPSVLRQAISLARRIVDPLLEIGQLFNEDEDILCVKHHPLQQQVDKEELLGAFNERLMEWTNIVGVDFNECLADNRKAHMLQFICGLGPSKAASLLRLFKRRMTKLKNRDQLISIGKLGKVVYTNCAGFIRINTMEMDSDDADIEYLDCTRIHPNHYFEAKTMIENSNDDDDGELVKKSMDDPVGAKERLLCLDLDEYDKYLAGNDEGRKAEKPFMRKVLDDIVEELGDPFKDPRKPYVQPSNGEEFGFLTKETAQTLYNGKLVLAKVTSLKALCKFDPDVDDPIKIDEDNWKCPKCKTAGFLKPDDVFHHMDKPSVVYLRLDSGLSGFLTSEKLSDQKSVKVDQRVKLNQTIYCRITEIDIGKRKVKLTSTGSDLRDESNTWKPPRDEDYDYQAEAEHLQKFKVPKPKIGTRGSQYTRRPIVHPCYQNISYSECVVRMENMEVGDTLFRPSSKGTDHLTLTWKIMDGVLCHVDILEQNKPDDLNIGEKLIVDKEAYDDLDEIIARYVFRMVSNVREVTSHKNFANLGNGGREKAEESLEIRAKENRNQLHYLLSVLKKDPGKILLSYLVSLSRLRFVHEKITIIPEGFQYRGILFESLAQCLRYFKLHYRDPPPTYTPSIGSSTSASSISAPGRKAPIQFYGMS